MKYDLIKYFKESFIKTLPSLILAFMANHFILFLFESVSWPLFVVKVAIAVTIYVVSVWFLSMNRSEKRIIINIIKRVRNTDEN